MESRSWYDTQRELDRIAAEKPRPETADNRAARRRKAAMDRLAQKREQKQKAPT